MMEDEQEKRAEEKTDRSRNSAVRRNERRTEDMAAGTTRPSATLVG